MSNVRNCKLNQGDFISSLSDDILLTILSKLHIKEQARTSVLSSRWTNLWTYSSCLNIDAKDFVQHEADRRTKRLKFQNTVDRMLGKHRGQVIDQLKLTCSSDHCVFPRTVNSWIEIAKQKQVKALYLDGVQKFSLGSTPFTSLVTLCLKNSLLSFQSDSIIHDIISNSPNLLELSIINSGLFLQHLSISGPSLKLKHFELVDKYIRFIEISAPNLASFSFNTFGNISQPKICLKNIPLLTQLSCSLEFILHARCDLYPLLSQLVTLTLTISNNFIGMNIGNFPMLMNLKHLCVKLLSDSDRQLRLLLELFRSCSYLRKLSFDFGTLTPKRSFFKNFPNFKFLEELEIYNFKESKYEVQLLICVVETCSSLQKVIIRPDSNERKVDQKCWESVLAAGKELEVVFKSCITDNF